MKYKFISLFIVFLGLLVSFSLAKASIVPTPYASFETYLANQEGTADTSLVIANATDNSGNIINGYVCFTVDQGLPTQEYECGTASSTTISNLSRGLDTLGGTTTISTNIYQHRRGASVQITDWPWMGIVSNKITGLDGFDDPIYYNVSPTFSSLPVTTIPDVQYVNSVVAQGAATSTVSIAGISFLSVSAANVNVPIVVGTNDPRVPLLNQTLSLASGLSGTTTITSAVASTTGGGTFSTTSTFYFKVSARQINGFTLPSTEATSSISATTSSIVLSWNVVSGASGYNLYFSTTTNSESNYFVTANTTYNFATTSGSQSGAVPTANGTLASSTNLLIPFSNVATTSFAGAYGAIVMASSTNGQIDPSFLASTTASTTSYFSNAFSVFTATTTFYFSGNNPATTTFRGTNSWFQNTTGATKEVTVIANCPYNGNNSDSASLTDYINTTPSTSSATEVGIMQSITSNTTYSGTAPFAMPFFVPNNDWYEVLYASSSASCSLNNWIEYNF